MHPIALDKCLVKNAAEEAQKCVSAVPQRQGSQRDLLRRASSVGASTIDSTIFCSAKKPIIFGFSFDAADLKTPPNLFVLDPAGPFAVYPFGTIGSDFLIPKTAALVHPEYRRVGA